MNTRLSFCDSCGAALAPEVPFCPQCGQSVSAMAARPALAPPGTERTSAPPPLPLVRPDADTQVLAAPGSPPARTTGSLTWESDIPLLTNRFLLLDFALVLGLAVLIIEGLVWALSFFFTDEPVLLPLELWAIPLAVIVALFGLVAVLVYGNRFHGRFTLDDRAVVYAVGAQERKINRIVMALALLFGVWRALGPALLAQAREVSRVEWKAVYRFRVAPARQVITLYDSWHAVLRLYCPPERFAEILALVQAYSAAGAAWRARQPAPPRPVSFYLAWAGLTGLATLATLAWPWTTYEGVDRLGLLAGILVLGTGVTSAAWWSKLLALPAATMSLLFLVRLGLVALQPITGPSGAVWDYTYTLDTPQLLLAVVGGLGLLALSGAGWVQGGSVARSAHHSAPRRAKPGHPR